MKIKTCFTPPPVEGDLGEEISMEAYLNTDTVEEPPKITQERTWTKDSETHKYLPSPLNKSHGRTRNRTRYDVTTETCEGKEFTKNKMNIDLLINPSII